MPQPIKIEHVGTYRGVCLDHAVSETKNGYPQFVGKFRVTERYDENGDLGGEPGSWVDWSSYELEIDAYLVLFTVENGQVKPCLNYDQCQTAFGWDGKTFHSLNDLDLTDHVFQFRVEDNEYNNVHRAQVRWVDSAEATPGRSIKKLDATALTGLETRFAGHLGKKATATPVSAPAPVGKPTAPTKAAVKPAAVKPAAVKPAASAPPAVKKVKKAAKVSGGLPEECTKDEAWKTIHDLKTSEVTDDAVVKAWTSAAEAVMDREQVGDDELTPAMWAEIRNTVLGSIDSIPF